MKHQKQIARSMINALRLYSNKETKEEKISLHTEIQKTPKNTPTKECEIISKNSYNQNICVIEAFRLPR